MHTRKLTSGSRPHSKFPRIDYPKLAALALPHALAIARRVAPGGEVREGRVYVALNPRRVDKRLGSFQLRLSSGLWRDWALPETARGGDLISYVAYCKSLKPHEAAAGVARMLNIGAPLR